ncbi:hypothetical protein [Polyangium jinanense]|uniref:Uncharacterized protein n=1 Tax=Polyangium jinanense TaxID=2829994 RepID=A0A9X3X9Z3_9BACT|nr:hypothetical protein [Polyangium jinanense]MDC3958958.1 hypothetical protein [Polyangium jinanense]MDC3986417.1 hypothetical protein [Polyangium jinanense]
MRLHQGGGPALRLVQLTSVQREGDKVMVAGEQRKTEPFNYDCRSTGVIESYDLNNNPVLLIRARRGPRRT